jgi:hypothetical protein
VSPDAWHDTDDFVTVYETARPRFTETLSWEMNLCGLEELRMNRPGRQIVLDNLSLPDALQDHMR